MRVGAGMAAPSMRSGARRESPCLVAGSHVALVAPSGPLKSSAGVDQAMATAGLLGWRVSVGQNVLSKWDCFAGSDEERLSDLRAALLDESVDAIWCLRGGYGSMRLLPGLMTAVEDMAQRGRTQALIGYSDVTVLHAVWQRAGLVSYHGPTARAALTDWSMSLFQEAVRGVRPGSMELTATDAVCLSGGRRVGWLAGGNLATVTSLVGTPWAVDFRGAIAVLEDVGEATYRLDRMLTQLRLSGAFEGCAGVVFGNFTDCPPKTSDGERPLNHILEEFAADVGVPTIAGAPFGHIDDQWTLPLGALATLDADGCRLTVHRSA